METHTIYIIYFLIILGLSISTVLMWKALKMTKDIKETNELPMFLVTPRNNFISLKSGTNYKAKYTPDGKFCISAKDSGKYKYILSPDKLNVVGLA